jgi:hypothetical protein
MSIRPGAASGYESATTAALKIVTIFVRDFPNKRRYSYLGDCFTLKNAVASFGRQATAMTL